MFQRILVPLDGSPRAERDIPLAARLARATRGTIIFVQVIPSPISVGMYGYGSEAVLGNERESTLDRTMSYWIVNWR